MKFNLFALVILAEIICIAYSASTPVTWQPSTLIQTGTFDLASPTNGATASIGFWNGFALIPTVGLCIKSVTQTAPSNQISIRIAFVSASLTDVTWSFSNETLGTFSTITVGSLAIDNSITYVVYSSFQILESDYAPYSKSINTSNHVQIIGYLTGFSIDALLLMPTGGIKDLSIVASLWNSTHCRILSKQHNQTYLVSNSPSVGIVTVDHTVSLTYKTHYFDIKPAFTAINSINATISPAYSFYQHSTFFAGINAFIIASTQTFKFDFGYITLVLGSNLAFTSLTVGILHTRLRVCPPSFPEFMEVGELCYDFCPDGYYAVPVSHYCKLCHFSCLHCSSQNTCKSCESNSNRQVNLSTSLNGIDGLCSCKNYFYDDNTNRICPSCHYSCFTCYSSASNACLSCNDLDNRFITFETTVNNVSVSIGSCQCGSHYFDSGAHTCTECSYTCLTCSNAFSCLTCPPSRVFNSLTHQCDCITGYSDYGFATCKKQQNFKVMSAILYFCFIIFMFFLIIDKFKIQYIEGIWIIQLCFFSAAILNTESFYHPLRALAPIINGFNSLSNPQFDTLASSPGLAAIKIKTVFLGNANLMPAMALGIFIVGFLIWIINKILCELPDQLIKISDYFMYDGVFSIALFNTLNVFFSFGAQVDYYIQGYSLSLSSIVLNWIYIVAIVLLHIWISYQYLVHFEKFKVMNSALKKDSMNIRHPLIMKLVRTVQGFSLGIGYGWDIIPVQILVIEFIILVYLIIKRPYKSKIDVASSIINQVCIVVIILLMTFQSQVPFPPQTSRVTFSWIQVGLILLATVKTIVFYYFKTYKHYMSSKLDSIPQIRMNFGQTSYDPNAPENNIDNNQNYNNKTNPSFYQLDQNSSIQFDQMDIGIMRRKGTI